MMDDMGSEELSEEEDFVDTLLDISERDSYESYLTICYQNNRLGLAFYRCGNFYFELLRETYEYDDFSILKLAIQKLQPSLVIVNSKIRWSLAQFLKQHSNNWKETGRKNNNSAGSQASFAQPLPGSDISRFKIIAVPQTDFDYERAKNRIISIPIKENGMEDFQQRFIFLSSFLDFQDLNTIKAFGALLSTLEKELDFSESTRIHSARDELCFDYFNVGYVEMNRNSFEALEIFQEEWHPSVSKRGVFKKEGVSLFGLLNICQTKLGSYQLRKMFQQPIADIDVLIHRQEVIQFFLELNDELRISLIESLKPLRDIGNAFKNFRSSVFKLSDFVLYTKNLDHLTQLRKTVHNLKPMFVRRFGYECRLFNELFDSIADEVIHEMNHVLKLLINFDVSKRVNKLTLMNGIDETLDDLKQKFNSLPNLLREKMVEDRELNYVTEQYFDHMTYIYIPQMGFFVRMLTQFSQSIHNLRNYGYEVMFCATQYTFFKNDRMRQFDKAFGDLNSSILDRTNEVLTWLADTLCEDSACLRSCLYIAGEIDAMLALAQAAKDYKLVRPLLTVSGNLKISQGRHLIHEAVNAHHVVNDYLSDEEMKITVLYATNGAGKSVYLKQNGLIVYMAHIGSFVPAGAAEIPLIDQIFTRIKTLESISTQLSAFKSDLNQLISATKFAHRRSLVLIDTFGKGTLSKDALSLLTSSINYWSENDMCPHLLIASQFDLTKCMELFKDSYRVRFLKFHFRENRSTFCIRNMDNDDYLDDDRDQSTQSGIPEELIRRQHDLSENIDVFDLEKKFPDLEVKYCKFLSMADHILNVTDDVGSQNIRDILLRAFRIHTQSQDPAVVELDFTNQSQELAASLPKQRRVV